MTHPTRTRWPREAVLFVSTKGEYVEGCDFPEGDLGWGIRARLPLSDIHHICFWTSFSDLRALTPAAEQFLRIARGSK